MLTTIHPASWGIGLAILATGLGLLAVLPPDPTNSDIVWRLALCGLGFGLFQSPNKMILTSAPRERSGGAGGMLSTARLLGQSMGAALVAAVFGMSPQNPTSTILWLGVLLSATGCIASTMRAGELVIMQRHHEGRVVTWMMVPDVPWSRRGKPQKAPTRCR